MFCLAINSAMGSSIKLDPGGRQLTSLVSFLSLWFTVSASSVCRYVKAWTGLVVAISWKRFLRIRCLQRLTIWPITGLTSWEKKKTKKTIHFSLLQKNLYIYIVLGFQLKFNLRFKICSFEGLDNLAVCISKGKYDLAEFYAYYVCYQKQAK